MDYELLARELIRALRGHRSQTAFSRRLGYSSNVCYPWESGRRYPTAAETMRAAAVAGIDLRGAWASFYTTPPRWLDSVDPATPRGIAWILSDLRARTPIGDVARRAGASRYAVSRWLNGQTEPRLPQFLSLFDALSLRVLDLLSAMVDLSALPSAAEAWTRVEAQRRAAFELPWTQAVLRAIELTDYRSLAAHRSGWIAERIGISVTEEQRCIAALEASGQLRWDGSHWRLDSIVTVDTRTTPEHGRSMKEFWADQGRQQLEAGSQGMFSYNVFGVSEADLERLRKLHLAYFRQLRAIISESEPTERVAVLNLQLFALDPGAGGPRI